MDLRFPRVILNLKLGAKKDRSVSIAHAVVDVGTTSALALRYPHRKNQEKNYAAKQRKGQYFKKEEYCLKLKLAIQKDQVK